MGVIELGRPRDEITQRQRYSHYFVLIFGVISLFIGINLRAGAIGATTLYTDTRAGITALYPQNWLIDTAGDEYVFRVRDMAQPGFKTLIQITTRPVGFATTTRNILDDLSLTRAQTLAAYSVFAREPYTLPDEGEAIALSYAFAVGDTDPFLESLPLVVRGLDVITLRGGQALIITFQADADTYAQQEPIFRQFLSDLEF